MLRHFVWIVITCLALTANAQTLESSQGTLKVQKIADGFDVPWGLAFLPDGRFLVTEREGRLWLVTPDGTRQRLRGLPNIWASGQGGLMDVLVPRDFARTGEILLSYSKPQPGGAGTAVASARLLPDQARLRDLREIFEMRPGSSGGRHFGSRLVEAPDGRIFLSIGERGDRPSAQDLTRHNGSIVRINRDGSVPADNPFVSTAGAMPEIWSYGHRNPQGMALDLSGQLWAVEHGARGGDEVNRIKPGANYGWPVISYGRHYSGRKIGEGTEKAGMEQPAHFWDPSIAPSGMVVYSGKLWPAWRGDTFVGSLKFDYIARLSGQTLREVEQLRSAETGRIRDVREAPDGSLWFLSETEGAVFRMSP